MTPEQPDKQPSDTIEDLTPKEEESAELKGGAIDGYLSHSGHEGGGKV